ncbi:MAG TPA: hypothetical protein VFX03_12615, partial [Thermomicrobiales bacterium]|nr:hypothetical protein [Thermomicrobiales bacterium]
MVEGNYIGTDVTGEAAVPNTAGGVYLDDGSSNQTIGGTTAAARNVISGNNLSEDSTHPGAGIYIGESQASTNNTIEGNYIGIDAAGAKSLPNLIGIDAHYATNNTIGGAGDGNVISGNTGDGILIESVATGTTIAGNYIGTNATGTAAVGNSAYGISIASAVENTVGGATLAAANVISGNKLGGVSLTGNAALPGTVSWYKADGNANDAIGGNSGTLVGGATFAPGLSGQAFSLDGVNSYLDMGSPANGSLDFGTGDFTIELWVNPASYGSVILSKGAYAALPAGSRSGYYISLLSGQVQVEASSVDANGLYA